MENKPRGPLNLRPEESGKVSYWEVTAEQVQRDRWHLATRGGAKRGVCKWRHGLWRSWVKPEESLKNREMFFVAGIYTIKWEGDEEIMKLMKKQD